MTFCNFQPLKTIINYSFFLYLPQCLTSEVALSVLEDDGTAYITEEDYHRISTVLLYYIINLQDLCVSNAAKSSSSLSFENYQFYLLALTNLHPAENNLFLSSREAESILQLINEHYEPSNQNASADLQVRNFYRRKPAPSRPSAPLGHDELTFDSAVCRCRSPPRGCQRP